MKDNFNLKEIINKLTPESRVIWERIFNWREIEVNLEQLPEKYSDFKKQKIIFIQDKILDQEAIFNFSRQKRPQPQKKEEEEIDDPFCHYQTETPIDELGRLEGQFVTTAANLSKMADYHSLLIFKKHQFDFLDSNDFKEAIEISQQWFQKIKNYDPAIQTQILIWNYHYRSGASILHPHFQLLAYKEIPIKLKFLFERFKNYQTNFTNHYLNDYCQLAQELGLGEKIGNFNFWFSLTPPKEKGLFFYGDLNNVFIWQIIKKLNQLGTESFNLFFIVESPLLNNFGFFVDRGKTTKLNSDIGSLELFGLPVISTNPFELAEELFNNFSLD
ncbi:MAG: hypothetical protein KatS3mg093_037 [Candidatus Parcubacteria bacterium]|nr:MAG: hypothetical protein KatS3mg093_037 [Candidatus Parcubacteria bacterium]